MWYDNESVNEMIISNLVSVGPNIIFIIQIIV